MPKFYTSVILLINQSKEISEKHFSVFGSRGGQNNPIMHVPLYKPLYTGFISLLVYQNMVKCVTSVYKTVIRWLEVQLILERCDNVYGFFFFLHQRPSQPLRVPDETCG